MKKIFHILLLGNQAFINTIARAEQPTVMRKRTYFIILYEFL